jgi:PAS domain S-box-containing protein
MRVDHTLLDLRNIHRRGNIARYGLAIVTSLLALVVRFWMHPWLEGSSPFWFFAPAVMISAWFGGRGPGIVATMLGAFLGNYFLLEPFQTFSLTRMDIGKVGQFFAVGILISWFSGEMYTARRRAEMDAAAARNSEKLYRTLASNFPDGFVGLFDGNFRWTLVAGAGLALAGLAREQMEGRTIKESLAGSFGESLDAACRHALEANSRIIELSTGGRTYSCHALCLKSDTDPQHAGMVIVEDNTERARARDALQWAHDNLENRVRERTAELHFQKTLLESQTHASADGVLAVGNDGRILFANRRMREMWQLDLDHQATTFETVKAHMRGMLERPKEDPLATDASEHVISQPDGVEELALGDGRCFERYSSPIIDASDTSYGRVWFFRDITERKRLEREILEAGEKERQHIGQDLHDDLCQQLAGIACISRLLQQNLQQNADRANAKLAHDIVTMVQQANERARDLARGLQPVKLVAQGFSTALAELCATVSASFRVRCEFHAQDAPVTLDEGIGIQLYRIAQEAISNAVRHGKARRVDVSAMVAGDRLILTVEDDGCGIPDPLPQGGMGLSTMDYRARLLGGTFLVERGDKKGTVVTCSVPIQPETQPKLPAAIDFEREEQMFHG